MTAQTLNQGVRRVELVATAIAAGVDAEFASKLANESADELITMICAVAQAKGIAELAGNGELTPQTGSDLRERRVVAHLNEVISRAISRETVGAE